MSMPSYWFDPIGGNAATGQPAMSADQINASMGWNPNAPQFDPFANTPGGFGAQTAAYAGAGAAYGRQTGYYGDTLGLSPGETTPVAQAWAGTGFDPVRYLQENPDVAAVYGNDPAKAYDHARFYGVNEGRGGTDMLPAIIVNEPQSRVGAGFSAYPDWTPSQQQEQSYPQNFNDTWRGRITPQLPETGPSSVTVPQEQGSLGSTDFSAQGRGGTNPINRVDWGASFGTAGGDLGAQVRQWGAEQPGRYDPELDRLSGAAWNYLNENRDVKDYFNGDIYKGAQHAQGYGKNEGRSIGDLPGGTTAEAYMNANQDVLDWSGGDIGKAFQHWQNTGQFENRDPQGLSKGSAQQYMEANPDVARFVGNDPAKALQHWQNAGQFEGREGFGLLTRDTIANTLAGKAQEYGNPSLNPSYFNPGTYAGDQGNYGIPYNGQPLPGDVGFSRQPSYPNIGYNPGMENQFANPGMNSNQFQNRFGMGFPGAGTPSQIYPDYGSTLSPDDRYGNGQNPFVQGVPAGGA
jgi:hypothetical protein